MKELRTYQEEAVNKLIPDSFREGHRRIIRYAPMRSGKSIEQIFMAENAFKKNKRVIILTHRVKIFKGTLNHLANNGIPCVDLSAGKKIPIGEWKIMMAMQATLWGFIKKTNLACQSVRTDHILQPDLILIDEIHRNEFSKIIEYFLSRAKQLEKTLFITAFSGTPQGKHLHKYFTKIVKNVDSPDLIATGDLVKCRAFQMQDEEIDLVKKSKGEFDEKEMFRHYDKANRYDGLIKAYREKVFGEKGIVFCVNIEHTVKTYEKFISEGINAFMVHSGNKNYPMLDSTMESMLKNFEASTDGVMINQGILDTGYDHPPIRWVAADKATTSLVTWLQLGTRGATPFPGKEYYTLLDMGMNHNRHGLVHGVRTWTLDPPKKRQKLHAAAMRSCPSCSALLPASVRQCEYCQYIFPKPTSELKNGVLVEVESDVPLGLMGKRISELSIEELIQCQKTKKLKHSYVWRVLRTKEKEWLDDVASDGGFMNSYSKLMGYKQGWLFSERKKITEGQVGYRDYILR